MDFALLQQRLVDVIRSRVRSGTVTERGLARLAGISQPHVHNVLKGSRGLSTEMADTLLKHLRLDVFDLIGEQGVAIRNTRSVPAARQPIGPGSRLVLELGVLASYPFRAGDLEGVRDAIAAQVAPDVHLPGPLEAGDWLLLDRAAPARREPHGEIYMIHLEGEDLLRRVSSDAEHVLIQPAPSIPLADRDILDVVRAKVIWFGRRLEPGPRE